MKKSDANPVPSTPKSASAACVPSASSYSPPKSIELVNGGGYRQLFTLPMITDSETAQVVLQTLYRQNPEWAHLEGTEFDWLWKRACATRQKVNSIELRASGKSDAESQFGLMALSVEDLIAASFSIHDEYQALRMYIARWAEEQKVVDRIQSNKTYHLVIFDEATNNFSEVLTEASAEEAVKNLMRRSSDKVVSELIRTEETYIFGLKRLKSSYATPLKSRMNKHDYDLMFAEIGTLLSAHETFLSKLKFSNSVVQEFLQFANYFKLYTVYSASFSRVPMMLENLKKNNSRIRKIIQEADNSSMADAPGKSKRKSQVNPGFADMRLHSLLQLPIMRLPRYELLLKELGKWTPPRTLHLELDMSNERSSASVQYVDVNTCISLSRTCVLIVFLHTQRSFRKNV